MRTCEAGRENRPACHQPFQKQKARKTRGRGAHHPTTMCSLFVFVFELRLERRQFGKGRIGIDRPLGTAFFGRKMATSLPAFTIFAGARLMRTMLRGALCIGAILAGPFARRPILMTAPLLFLIIPLLVIPHGRMRGMFLSLTGLLTGWRARKPADFGRCTLMRSPMRSLMRSLPMIATPLWPVLSGLGRRALLMRPASPIVGPARMILAMGPPDFDQHLFDDHRLTCPGCLCLDGFGFGRFCLVCGGLSRSLR